MRKNHKTRFLLGLTGLLAAASAWAATLSPVQLLSPAGSTAGQTIVSTGPSTAPGWAAVPLTGVTGVLPIANGGTNASTASAALSNLGGAALTGATFTGDVRATSSSGGRSIIVDAIPGQRSILRFRKNNIDRWWVNSNGTAEGGANAGSNFEIVAYDDTGTLLSTPLTIVRSTGVATFSARPVFGAATPWDSANLNFATPPAIGGTTPAAGAFTTLSATGAITPSQTAGIVGTTTNNNANAGSVGQYISSNVALGSAVSLTASTAANVTSISLTAGDWDCQGNVWFNPAGTTTSTNNQGWISTVSATLPTPPNSGMQTGSTSAITTGSGGYGFQVGPGRLSLASTTTVYLGAFSAFGTSTNAAYGFIGCRRMR